VADLGELTIAIVELEGILKELVKETGSLFEPIDVDIFEGKGSFQPLVVIRHHIRCKDLRESVIVDIGHIRAHGSQADMTDAIFQVVFEGAVVLVDIEIIPFEEIVGDIDIGPAVAIDIANHHTESEADEAAMDAGFFGHFGKMAVAVVAEEVVAAAFERVGDRPGRCLQVAFIGIIQGVDGNRAVVDEEAVQVAVAVIIEEGGLGGITRIGQSVLCGGIDEGIVVAVDEELVFSEGAVVHMSRVADIDVEPAVAVDIGHYDTGAPLLFTSRESCLFRYILELKIAFIEIELVGAHIGSEEDVGQAVVIDVSDGYAAAIVEIPVGENIEIGFILDVVGEPDAGVGHLIEEGRDRGGCMFTGRRQHKQSDGDLI